MMLTTKGCSFPSNKCRNLLLSYEFNRIPGTQIGLETGPEKEHGTSPAYSEWEIVRPTATLGNAERDETNTALSFPI